MTRKGVVFGIGRKWKRVILPSAGGGPIFENKKIRFMLHGCANRPFYHIVVTNKGWWRDSHPAEQLGTYDPMPNQDNQKILSVNIERLRHWIGLGATFTDPVSEVLGLVGFLPIHPTTYTKAWQNRRAEAIEEQKKKEAEQKQSQLQPPSSSDSASV